MIGYAKLQCIMFRDLGIQVLLCVMLTIYKKTNVNSSGPTKRDMKDLPPPPVKTAVPHVPHSGPVQRYTVHRGNAQTQLFPQKFVLALHLSPPPHTHTFEIVAATLANFNIKTIREY